VTRALPRKFEREAQAAVKMVCSARSDGGRLPNVDSETVVDMLCNHLRPEVVVLGFRNLDGVYFGESSSPVDH